MEARRKPKAEPTPAPTGTITFFMPSLRASRAACSGAAPPKAISARSAVSLPFSTACTRAALAMVSSTISTTPAAAPCGIRLERAGKRLQRRLGLVAMQRDGAARKARGIEAAEGGVGIGHGGLGAAAAIARRAGYATGRIGTDLNAAQRIHAGDRAAAGADLDQLDDRNADGEAGALHEAIGTRDLELARALQLEIVEQGELGRGAAHVEGDGLAGIVLGRDRAGQDGAAGGSGFDEAHRITPRRVDGRDAARRHHQQERACDAFRLQVGFELPEIAGHAWQHIGVGDGRRGALVLADLGADFAGERDRNARQFLGQDRRRRGAHAPRW